MTKLSQERLKTILENVEGHSVEKINKKLLIYIIKKLERIEERLNKYEQH